MKETPITGRHRLLGARLVDFAGYCMPLSYAGITQEHLAVRERCGIFDVSHMGEFIVRGKEALDLVQHVTTNDASKLKIGQAQYSCLTKHDGGIIDDLLVYRLDEDQCSEGEQAFMLVVNASNIDKDFSWIKEHNTFDTRLINISEQTGLLAIQGPISVAQLQPHTETNLSDIAYYRFKKGSFAGRDNILISATGYTGSGGFELYGLNEDIAHIWDALMDVGDMTPIGLAARDTLRLEMGYCLYGNDLSESTTPLEAGLGWITKLKKGPFIGREALLQQKEDGTVRRLMGLKVRDKRVPRPGYKILDADGQECGHITSGTHSPSLDAPIGMGYIDKAQAKVGNEVVISTGRKELSAEIVSFPFIEV
ncbi:MAG: glycine cleavage system aminomethyltransferase GcvT [Saprospiraceae bacterium]|nr:glycine cleavage system aminomethyltransferase GcvT [Saprospiraceae bacterium]